MLPSFFVWQNYWSGTVINIQLNHLRIPEMKLESIRAELESIRAELESISGILESILGELESILVEPESIAKLWNYKFKYFNF
ncbi:hypothetical protein [Planomicrobium okeanokoites]|uniref:hypothetical protein n=1 Tax=Planomicrobium okeanokoites TaxID=244 RepID=UPI0015C4440C|nr:hypothetical protein [Planomicrobium okeanokoites]